MVAVMNIDTYPFLTSWCIALKSQQQIFSDCAVSLSETFIIVNLRPAASRIRAGAKPESRIC